MTITDSIFKEALTLSPPEKAKLVDKLISSLDKPDKEIDELWATYTKWTSPHLHRKLNI